MMASAIRATESIIIPNGLKFGDTLESANVKMINPRHIRQAAKKSMDLMTFF